MSQVLSWLHLSDFHVGKDDYGQRQLFDQLLTHVAVRTRDRGAPDLVIISGDIANRGLETEYATFGEQFFLPLTELLGSGVRSYSVPGNHDVDRSQARIVQFDRITESCRTVLDPSIDGLSDR